MPSSSARTYSDTRRSTATASEAREGAQEISKPVVFAVLTTVAAFTPLLFVPGFMGKMMIFVPLVVIPCLLFSLLESMNILPAHLAHIPKRGRPGLWRRFQGLFTGGLAAFVRHVYEPTLGFALRWRYLTIAIGLSTLIVTVGMVLAGWVAFQFFPSPEAKVIAASVTMPQGTPASVTSEVVQRLEMSVSRLRREVEEETGADVFRHVYAAVGDQPMVGRGPGAMQAGPGQGAGHLGEVMIELARAEEREIRAEEIGNRWRELTGPIPEATKLAFKTDEMSAGDDVDRTRRRATSGRGRAGEGTPAAVRRCLRHLRHLPGRQARAQARHHAGGRNARIEPAGSRAPGTAGVLR